MAKKRGLFIVFEGLDGSGLSTQARLLAEWLEKNRSRSALTKEPTDGPAGAQIRMALEGRLKVDEETLALLFAADRMDHLASFIKPRLAEGVHVVCDRYYLSSLAYQSTQAPVAWVRQLNSRALRPDIIIVLKVPPRICRQRMARSRFGLERYESEAQLAAVWRNYQRLIPQLRKEGERVAIIDGTPPIEEVQRAVIKAVAPLLDKKR